MPPLLVCVYKNTAANTADTVIKFSGRDKIRK